MTDTLIRLAVYGLLLAIYAYIIARMASRGVIRSIEERSQDG